MTVALGSGQADDPEGVSDPGAPIKSEAVLTLVMTRAHVVAVMRDPRLSVHAKMVGCLLWSTTETWERGESKTVSFKEIGAQIVLERRGRTGPLSEASVRRALNELEDAGYARVDKSGCVGRGKPSTVTMVRRRLADPLTQDASGPWRVWTKRQMDDVAAREEMTNEPEAAPAATAEGFPVRHPLKETSLEEDLVEADLDKQTLPPLAERSASAPAPDQPQGRVTGVMAARWDDLRDPDSILDFLSETFTTAVGGEMDRRKRREVLDGINGLLGSLTVPEVVLGLGYWAEDRRLANADILGEVVTQRLKRCVYDAETLLTAMPWEVLVQGAELGAEARRSRLNGAGGGSGWPEAVPPQSEPWLAQDIRSEGEYEVHGTAERRGGESEGSVGHTTYDQRDARSGPRTPRTERGR